MIHVARQPAFSAPRAQAKPIPSKTSSVDVSAQTGQAKRGLSLRLSVRPTISSLEAVLSGELASGHAHSNGSDRGAFGHKPHACPGRAEARLGRRRRNKSQFTPIAARSSPNTPKDEGHSAHRDEGRFGRFGRSDLRFRTLRNVKWRRYNISRPGWTGLPTTWDSGSCITTRFITTSRR